LVIHVPIKTALRLHDVADLPLTIVGRLTRISCASSARVSG